MLYLICAHARTHVTPCVTSCIQLPSGLVQRPDLGKAGRRVKVMVNMFKVGLRPDQRVWQYDVSVVRALQSQQQQEAAGGGGAPAGEVY